MAYAESLSALSDPTRRMVFESVAQAPKPVSALAQTLPVSRPAVSQHLKVLSDAGLVQVRAEGTRRIYSVRSQGLADLRAYLDQFWEDVLTSYAADVQHLEGADNDTTYHQNS